MISVIFVETKKPSLSEWLRYKETDNGRPNRVNVIWLRKNIMLLLQVVTKTGRILNTLFQEENHNLLLCNDDN